jgi:Fe-S cluster assembly iron-binding protein IscA
VKDLFGGPGNCRPLLEPGICKKIKERLSREPTSQEVDEFFNKYPIQKYFDLDNYKIMDDFVCNYTECIKKNSSLNYK